MKKYQKVNEEKLKERNNNIVKPPKKKKKKKAHQRINQAKKLILWKLIGKSHSRFFKGKNKQTKQNKQGKVTKLKSKEQHNYRCCRD